MRRERRPSIRILIIDDDSLVRWTLARMLTRRGCTIVEREDGGSAVRTLTESTDVFDVILHDHNLPDGSGLELLTTLKRLAPATTVLMMSAHMSSDDVDESLRRGAAAVLPKPFDLDVVWDLIVEVQSRHWKRRRICQGDGGMQEPL
jgi:two-component system nitrogen regulation response regulator GlnG